MHAHKKVMVKGYVDRVEIALGAEIVARHRRSMSAATSSTTHCGSPARAGIELDSGLRYVAPSKRACKREYIQVMRLLEDFPERQVTEAVRDAVKRRVIGFDAVKHRYGPHREAAGARYWWFPRTRGDRPKKRLGEEQPLTVPPHARG